MKERRSSGLAARALFASCALAYLCLMHFTTSVRALESGSIPSADQFDALSDKNIVGGLRVINTVEDLAAHVLGERRPTILLLWSSKQEECEAPYDCTAIEKDFQTAAAATKNYVRFAELDVATSMGKEIVKSTMGEAAMKALPKFLLFEKPTPMSKRAHEDIGRKASPVTIGMLETYVPAFKELASRLLPVGGLNVVESVASSLDFTVKANEAKRAAVLYLSPKGKPTLAGRTLEVMLDGFGNMAYVYPENIPKKTLDALSARWNVPVSDLMTTHSRLILLSSQEGVSYVMPRNAEDREPTVDEMFHFVLTALQEEMKKLAVPIRVQRLNSDISAQEFQRQILLPDPPTLLAFRHKDTLEEEVPPVEPEAKEGGLAWAEVATTMEAVGGQALMIYCTESSTVCKEHVSEEFTSGWTFKTFHHRVSTSTSDTVKEQAQFDKASEALASALDKIALQGPKVVHEIKGVSGKDSKVFDKCIEAWQLDGSNAKLPLVFVDDSPKGSPPPVWVVALAEALASIAQVFRVTDATSRDIGEILVDKNENGTYVTPAMFSFLPDSQHDGNLRAIVYEAQTMGKLGFNPALTFGFNLFRIINEQRSNTWLNTIRPILPASTRALRSVLAKEEAVNDIATRNVTRVTDAHTLRAACGSSPVCVIGVLLEDDDSEDASQNLQIYRTARSQYYAAGGLASIPWVYLKGPCVPDPRFLDTLGVDAGALPIVTVWSTSTTAGPLGGFVSMRGVFESQRIAKFARDATSNRVSFSPLTAAGLDAYLTEPEACPEKPEEEAPLDPDFLKEMKTDEEREEAMKKEIMRVAKEEAAKLIKERTAETEARQTDLHRKAEEEALKRRRQEEL